MYAPSMPWFWWVLIVVLGVIPIAFWTVWAILQIVRWLGDKADDLLRWGEERF